LQQLSSTSNHASISTFQSSSVISEEIMNDNLSTSEESSESIILEENTRIRKAIVSWTQGKVTKAGWLALRESFDNISIKTSLDAGELKCVIKCFCGVNYIISKFAKRSSKSKRWIYSNFQTHLLKKHIQNINSAATKSFVNQKNCITDYVLKAPSKFSNAKVIHDIEFADTENVNKTSQLVDNKDNKVKIIDKAEVVDIVKIIEYKAEIIFDTVNAISTIEDNRYIISPKINEEHDCFVSDSSYVIDLNIDSNIPICSSFNPLTPESQKILR